MSQRGTGRPSIACPGRSLPSPSHNSHRLTGQHLTRADGQDIEWTLSCGYGFWRVDRIDGIDIYGSEAPGLVRARWGGGLKALMIFAASGVRRDSSYPSQNLDQLRCGFNEVGGSGGGQRPGVLSHFVVQAAHCEGELVHVLADEADPGDHFPVGQHLQALSEGQAPCLFGKVPGQWRRLGDLNPGWARTQTALAVPSLSRKWL